MVMGLMIEYRCFVLGVYQRWKEGAVVMGLGALLCGLFEGRVRVEYPVWEKSPGSAHDRPCCFVGRRCLKRTVEYHTASTITRGRSCKARIRGLLE